MFHTLGFDFDGQATPAKKSIITGNPIPNQDDINKLINAIIYNTSTEIVQDGTAAPEKH